jgi:hypothetical protein
MFSRLPNCRSKRRGSISPRTPSSGRTAGIPGSATIHYELRGQSQALVPVMEELNGLLEAYRDQQADRDGRDMDEKIPPRPGRGVSGVRL